MSKQKTHIIIGIDIGSRKTRLVIAEHTYLSHLGKKSFPKILQTLEVETGGVFRGDIVDEKEVMDTLWSIIQMIEKSLKNQIRHIIISLNASGISSVWGHSSILNTNLTGEIDPTLITRIEEEAKKNVGITKNKKHIHTIPIKYKIDQNEIQGSPINMLGKKIEGKLLFISSPISYIDKLENIFSQLNLDIDDMVVGPFAECNMLLNKKERIAGVALINFGHSTTSLLVYENNNPIILSVLPCGSNDITNDIALGFQVSLEEAEDIKCGKSALNLSKRKLEEIVEARIADICEKINIELQKIARKELLPGGVVLTGGGSAFLGIEALFKHNLKLPIKFSNEELFKKTNKQLHNTNYAKALGLTYFASIINEEYKTTKILKTFFSKIIVFFKKIIP